MIKCSSAHSSFSEFCSGVPVMSSLKVREYFEIQRTSRANFELTKRITAPVVRSKVVKALVQQRVVVLQAVRLENLNIFEFQDLEGN